MGSVRHAFLFFVYFNVGATFYGVVYFFSVDKLCSLAARDTFTCTIQGLLESYGVLKPTELYHT